MLIDVSAIGQGTINWSQADPAIDGAYIKLTEGTGFVDPQWRANHDGATAGGTPCGAYHFADLADPVAEANHFADQYLQAAWQLRPVLDIETNGATAGWIASFRQQFRLRVNFQPFRIYTSRSFLQSALNPANWMDGATDIWAAAYGPTLGWDHPALVLWQNSDAANVPGVLGSVDSDQFMHGWTPAADQGADLTPEEHQMLADIHEQLYGTGAREAGSQPVGYPLLQPTLPGAQYTGPPLTLVDFARQIHREVVQRLPNRVDGKSTDTQAGFSANGDMYGYKTLGAVVDLAQKYAAQQGTSAQDIATALAPLVVAALPAHLNGLSADDLKAVAGAVADEEARRLTGSQPATPTGGTTA